MENFSLTSGSDSCIVVCMTTVTYAQAAERTETIAAKLERIAYRLRQGAISPESASSQLEDIAAEVAFWS